MREEEEEEEKRNRRKKRLGWATATGSCSVINQVSCINKIN